MGCCPLPTGTANDEGKSFGLDGGAPEALERNIDVIRAAHETRLDVGIYRSGGAGESHERSGSR